MNGIVSDVSKVSDLCTTGRNEANHSKQRNPKRQEFVHTTNSQKEPKPSPEGKANQLCWLCKQAEHKVRFCEDFKQMNISDRLKVVDKYKLCTICLNSHGKRSCTVKLRCGVGNCQGDHHALLHRVNGTVQISHVECNTHNRAARTVIFRMLPVTIHVGGVSMDVVAFLDEGSSVTLIENEVARQMKIHGEPEPR